MSREFLGNSFVDAAQVVADVEVDDRAELADDILASHIAPPSDLDVDAEQTIDPSAVSMADDL